MGATVSTLPTGAKLVEIHLRDGSQRIYSDVGLSFEGAFVAVIDSFGVTVFAASSIERVYVPDPRPPVEPT